MSGLLTPAKVIRLFRYDPITGYLHWRVKAGPQIRVGQRAGYTCGRSGYVFVKVGGKKYRAHRIAWLIHTGSWPKSEIDHINHARHDNRLENLRECTPGENHRNKSMRSDNTSGICGVSWDRRCGKWLAHIKIGGEAIIIGYHGDKLDAVCARKNAEAKYGFHPNHGK